jgi:hypothetical protein
VRLVLPSERAPLSDRYQRHHDLASFGRHHQFDRIHGRRSVRIDGDGTDL